MASPQPEDGYTRIANELQEALCRTRIPGEARQVLDVIFRHTYGWNRKAAYISLGMFASATGLKKPAVLRALHTLSDMRIIVIENDNEKQIVIKNDNDKPAIIENETKNEKRTNAATPCYRIQKDYESWKSLSKKITISRKESSVQKKCYCCGFTEVIVRHLIVPVKEGGDNKVSNAVMLCPNCSALVKNGKISREELFSKKRTIEGVIENDNDNSQSSPLSLSKTITTNSVSRCGPTREDFKEKRVKKKDKSEKEKKETGTKEPKKVACGDRAPETPVPERNLEEEAKEVLAYLNTKKGRSYRNPKDILARLRDGGTVEQCKQIIDTKSQDPHFERNAKFFNPETLFRKCHWDTYLNERPEDYLDERRRGERSKPRNLGDGRKVVFDVE
jgi:phage replication O-like protein O